MRFVLTLILVFSGLAFTLTTAAPARAADCEFVLGFKTLHEMSPTIVGDCVDNARFDVALGEALQVTTGTRTDGGYGGLLVWRKADNLTWFTNGVNTWINGPQGLERRLNTQRFSWELDTLKAAAYNVQDVPFVLNEGKAELRTDSPQVIRLFASLDESNVAYGDLNGDGMADAAVRLTVNTGGSGVFNYLAAMVSRDGRTEQAASAFLGDRVRVNATSISEGRVTVDLVTQGPGEPLCCPTLQKTTTFRLTDGRLEEVGQ